MLEDEIIIDVDDENYGTVDILDLDSNAMPSETIQVVEVDDIETFEVESFDAFNALGEQNEGLKHQLLNGRDVLDQHPITAITGLRGELDDIKSLKTVYSDEKQIADYYEWEDGNIYNENRTGHFVSLCNDIRMIKICNGEDIFGVIVDNAGFIGGQDEIKRNYKYGLVAHTGVVNVRCELDVNVGDYIVSNNYGIAERTMGNYGCKVIAINKIDGVLYATISLNLSIDQMDLINTDVQLLNGRMDVAEKNIISAINVANEAYNKSVEIDDVSEEAIKNALEALKISQDMSNKTNELEEDVLSANQTAIQAKTIADSAIVSAETTRQEVLTRAAETLNEISNTKKELKTEYAEVQKDVDDALQEALKAQEETEALTKELQPLAEWKSEDGTKSGIAGFIARADADSTTLATLAEWKDEEDGSQTLAGTVAKVSEHEAILNHITSNKGASCSTIASVEQKATTNESSIKNIAAWKDTTSASIADIESRVAKNEAQINIATQCVDGQDCIESYYNLDGHLSNGIKYTVNSDGSIVANGTATDTSMFFVISETKPISISENTKVSISGCPDGGSGETYYFAMQSVDYADSFIDLGTGVIKNTSRDSYYSFICICKDTTVENLVFHPCIRTVEIEGMSAIVQKTNEHETIINSMTVWQGETSESMTKIKQESSKNSSNIESLTNFNNDLKDSVTSIKQQSDANGASITSFVSTVDKYSVGEYSQAYGLTQEQATNIIEEGTVYVPTKHANNEVGSHSESYPDDDGRYTTSKFTPGYYYVWTTTNKVDYMWVESGSPLVAFSSTEPIANESLQYWYIDSDTAPEGYEPKTLYKWQKIDDSNGRWIAVATLYGNSLNRATSAIIQKQNEIELKVAGANGTYGTIDLRLTADETSIKNLVEWSMDKDEGKQYNLATIQQTASDAGASIAQVVSSIGGYTTINGSWNATDKKTTQIYYTTTDKLYWYYKDNKWNSTKDPSNAGVKITTASIITAVNNSGSSVVLNADHINLNGVVTANETFKIDKNGYMTAIGGTIGGWNIRKDYIDSFTGTRSSYKTRFYLASDQNETATNYILARGSDGNGGYETKFKITKDGVLHAKGANISGKITAETGSIAGFTIGKSNIYNNALYKTTKSDDGKTKYEVGMKATNGDTDLAFYIRSSKDGWKTNTPLFYVRNNGELYATAGEIGGWTIDDTQFKTGKSTTKRAFYISSYSNSAGNWIKAYDDNGDVTFRVSKEGKIYATGATLSGNITATSGSFSRDVVVGGKSISNWINSKGQIYNANLSQGSINFDKYFSVSDSGAAQLSNDGGGFLTLGAKTTHPYVSALNVAVGSGGIVFRDGSGQSSIGNNRAQISIESDDSSTGGYCLKITTKGRLWINDYKGVTFQVKVQTNTGKHAYLAFYNGLCVGYKDTQYSTSTFPDISGLYS